MLRDRPSVLIGLLVALNLLSAADWMLTSRALANGAVEANVVVGVLAGASPLAAPLFKAAAMLAVTALIWFSRRYRLVLATAAGAVAVYLLLMLYHISGLVSIGAL